MLPLTLEEIYRGLTGEESVHLAPFPSSSGSRKREPGIHGEDDALIADMDRVQNICNAALAIRNKLNIRVRQPLQNIEIMSSHSKEIWENLALRSIIQDEINVKGMVLHERIDQYATLKLSINSQVLGKRLPALMKQILPASKKGEWKQIDGTVEIAGEKLLPSEYTLQLEPKPEYKDRAQPLSSNDALVILDTTITPELEQEGIARDVVRMVQQARKDAGLYVSDKILLNIAATAKVLDALGVYKEYILSQTLAEFSEALTQPLFSVENMLDDEKLIVSLSKR